MTKIKITVLFILIINLALLFGCQNSTNSIESLELNEMMDTEFFVNDWDESLYIRTDNSLESSLVSLMSYYGKDLFVFQEGDLIAFDLYGVSYMNLFERMEKDYQVISRYVDTDFDGIINEVKSNHPVISFRTIRKIVEDYVLFVGYDQQKNQLIGYTRYQKDPLFVSSEQWEQEYIDHGVRYTIFSTNDKSTIDTAKLADSHWIQLAIKAIYDQDYSVLEEMINEIENRNIAFASANNIRDFYYLIIKKELNDYVLNHTTLLYEAAPDSSFSNEFMLHRYLLQNDSSKVREILNVIEENEWFPVLHLETLEILKKMYSENKDIYHMNKVIQALNEKGGKS